MSFLNLDVLKSPLIIFVVGGPGCGKGTQCRNMASKYGFCHVGLGQLLREEAQRRTPRGRQIRDIMQQGRLVPTVRVHGRGGRPGPSPQGARVSWGRLRAPAAPALDRSGFGSQHPHVNSLGLRGLCVHAQSSM